MAHKLGHAKPAPASEAKKFAAELKLLREEAETARRVGSNPTGALTTRVETLEAQAIDFEARIAALESP